MYNTYDDLKLEASLEIDALLDWWMVELATELRCSEITPEACEFYEGAVLSAVRRMRVLVDQGYPMDDLCLSQLTPRDRHFVTVFRRETKMRVLEQAA